MPVSRLLDLARPYRSALIALAVLNCGAALFTLAVPWLGGDLLGKVIAGHTRLDPRLLAGLGLSLAAAAAIGVAALFQAARLGATVRADLRRNLFDHVQRLPIPFHDRHGKGTTLALLTYESWQLGQFLTGTLAATPARLLTVLGATILMFRINATLALIVPLLIPAFYLVLKIIGRRMRGLAEAQQRAEAGAIELAEEAIDMIPATKAFTREVAQNHRYRRATQEVADLTVRLGRIQSLIDPLMGLLAALSAVVVLILAGDGLRGGTLTTAGLFSFILYAALLTRPVSALAHIYGEFQVARGTLARLQTVLDEEPEALAQNLSAPPGRGEILFDDIRFSFRGRGALFEGLSLAIRPGETVALLGANGAGKSSLIALLLRYYDPDGGRICFDGRDISTIGLAALRRQIGLVPQLPYLFNGTIRDNIAFGREEGASDAMVEEAARLAQAHDFIARLPQGYATRIGDRGVRLSGGQRQRLALARALIKDPPILILDEATAMFDLEGEAGFISDCAAALAGRTTILVTHRPALLALADRQVEIANGRARELTVIDLRKADG